MKLSKASQDEARIAEIEHTHKTCCDYNQTERRDTRFMADNGHPFAADYNTLRAKFDSLKYACNTRARLLAYRSENEQAQYWAPELYVTTNPLDFRDFYNVHPARCERWDKYLRAAAEDGWPQEKVLPRLSPGSIIVYTWDAKLVGDLFGASNGAARIDTIDENGYSTHGMLQPKGYYHVTVNASNADCIVRCISVIERRMKRWCLPLRDAGDDVNDNLELPLAMKRFALANVKCVTVEPRQVLVPLIPCSAEGRDLAKLVVIDLLSLCEKGYPYWNVREWIEEFVSPEVLVCLDCDYGIPRNPVSE